ncbi:hypothetical protein [Methylobacterium sp. J-077]|uniref:hypothetical protein n=1 Tax=Methylobacterium sp. J-077 TaxID=2836656 RepID=UPI001FB99C7C|nr:hypothetical protein [Methylobacterium sp. J-077]MCJ2124937.1 hypothetical protein [Methylobacterium sp. J-077]
MINLPEIRPHYPQNLLFPLVPERLRHVGVGVKGRRYGDPERIADPGERASNVTLVVTVLESVTHGTSLGVSPH